jgi:hypothetical protein
MCGRSTGIREGRPIVGRGGGEMCGRSTGIREGGPIVGGGRGQVETCSRSTDCMKGRQIVFFFCTMVTVPGLPSSVETVIWIHIYIMRDDTLQKDPHLNFLFCNSLNFSVLAQFSF